ncbi:MAG: sigma-70 family RNA polymerase sigma factor [Bacteroidetes bacterium]|nr:sigma-70 family RNA polymerase sigma factor [Bacteroidota bacterium]
MIDLSDIDNVKQLVGDCIKGDRISQQKFYQLFYGKMLSICMRYSDNRDEAKDILHDGFIKVFGNLKNFAFNGSIEGWVKRIVTNTAIDSVRKKKNFLVEFEDNRNYDKRIDDFDDNIEFEQINQLKVEVIMQLIQKLSPMYKMVFNLYVFEELTHKEIAEELNINIGTSKSNYAKAKRNLKRFFEEYTNGNKK